MKGPKKLLAMVGVLAMLAALLVPAAVFGDTEDTATGTFSNNNVPSITSVILNDAAGSTPVITMTPQTAFDVKVLVTDADGLTDLDTIVVKIWYDATGGVPIESEFDAVVAGNAQTAIIITYTQGTPTWELTEEASSTWDLGTCVEGTADSGTAFEFKFTVGKVATETLGGAKWQIAAKVTDDSAESNTWGATSYDTDYSDMVWYGEISGVSGTVDWGTVNPGMAIAEGDPSEETLGVTVNYIANGAYDAKVSSSATWTSAGSAADATLDEDGADLAANAFSLKADVDDTLTDADFVTAAGVTINAAVAQTTEAGNDVTTNTLWLQLASAFEKDVYSGTITYIIANG
jgi:hypothetical protein